MSVPPFPFVDVTAGGAPELWTAHVSPGADQRVALHSTRAPRVEAQRQLDAIGAADTAPAIVALIGAGLGFVTEAARERWPGARIVVLEPSMDLARHARARTPELYESDRISLLTGPDYASDRPLWQLLNQGQGAAPALIVHPVIARLAPEATAAAEACARRAIQAAQMNERARQDNAPRYLLHTLRNLVATVDGIDLTALYGRLTGVPIAVVAAGPSLDRQLDALRALAGRALVIAADTAWRPLAAAGIDPHIVVALDPTELNGRHLLNVPARRQPWLLAELSVDPRVVSAFGARIGAFRVANHHPWPWAGTLGLNAPVVRVWGSVVTACTDLALSFGGDPIMFAGADLAFTRGQPYCRGTTFEEDWARATAHGWDIQRLWEQLLASKPMVMIPDVNGVETRTAPYLIEFRDWLAARASEHRDRRFVNTTGGGILGGEHIEQVDLASIVEALPERAAELDNLLNAAWPEAPRAQARRQSLRDALRALERDAAAAAATGGSVAAPLSDWRQFGEPRLTLTDVHVALVDSGRVLDQALPGTVHQQDPHAQCGASIVRPSRLDAGEALTGRRRHAADRAAQMRAWLSGEDADGACVDERAAAGAPAGAALVGQALARLLGQEAPLVSRSAEIVAVQAAAECVPLSHRFEWTPEKMPLVANLEEALLDAREMDARNHLGHGDAASAFWRRPAPPSCEADDDEAEMTSAVAAAEDVDAIVRANVFATVTRLMTASGEWSRTWKLCDAAMRGLADPRYRRTAKTPYQLRWRGGPIDVPLRIEALMGALTGTVAPLSGFRPRSNAAGQALPLIAESRCAGDDDTRIEPRLAFLQTDTTYVEPIVLTERGLPPGAACETMSDTHATFVPVSSRSATLIDDAGRASANRPWPDDVSVEAAWGTAGGAIAWSIPRSEVFCRVTPEAEVTRATLPFQSNNMVVGRDTAFWVAMNGGLWEWGPGRDARPIAVAPAHGWLELAGAHLIVHPVERDATPRRLAVWRRLPYAWRYEIATGAHDRVSLPAVGQSARTRVRESWTVRSHVFADCVTFTHRDGRVLGLACQSPFGIAWAGTSLIVTTWDHDVLLFRDLWRVISTFA
jgi:hypothetical protein